MYTYTKNKIDRISYLYLLKRIEQVYRGKKIGYVS